MERRSEHDEIVGYHGVHSGYNFCTRRTCRPNARQLATGRYLGITARSALPGLTCDACGFELDDEYDRRYRADAENVFSGDGLATVTFYIMPMKDFGSWDPDKEARAVLQLFGIPAKEPSSPSPTGTAGQEGAAWH